MFDPYHKWLGIPRDRRPPTFYQLLAIAPTEDDPEVIEAASIRQSAYVRNFQKGPHAAESTRILGEIAQARATLLDPEKRRAYEATLLRSENGLDVTGRLGTRRPAAVALAAVAIAAMSIALVLWRPWGGSHRQAGRDVVARSNAARMLSPRSGDEAGTKTIEAKPVAPPAPRSRAKAAAATTPRAKPADVGIHNAEPPKQGIEVPSARKKMNPVAEPPYVVAHWRFEEGMANAPAIGRGSILDSSVNGLHGTPINRPVYRADVVAPRIGTPPSDNTKSIEFDGIGNFIFVEDDRKFQLCSAVTLEAILKVRRAKLGSRHEILFRGDDQGRGSEPPPLWIWYPTGKTLAEIPADTVFFRKEFQVDNPSTLICEMTADNAYTLFLDGVEVARGADWSRAQSVVASLDIGKHVLAAIASNWEIGAAGLLVRGVVLPLGQRVAINTDHSWKSTNVPPVGDSWRRPGFEDSSWRRAAATGTVGSTPWNELKLSYATFSDGSMRTARVPYRLSVEDGDQIAFTIMDAQGRESKIRAPIPGCNTWFRVAATFDVESKKMRLYINGRLEKSVMTASVPAAYLDLSKRPGLCIAGVRSDPKSDYFNGWIDEIRISDRALRPGQFLEPEHEANRANWDGKNERRSNASINSSSVGDGCSDLVEGRSTVTTRWSLTTRGLRPNGTRAVNKPRRGFRPSPSAPRFLMPGRMSTGG